MLNTEQIDKIIDRYALRFLDEFEEDMGKLPTDLELAIWRVGVIDGIEATQAALLYMAMEKEKAKDANS